MGDVRLQERVVLRGKMWSICLLVVVPHFSQLYSKIHRSPELPGVELDNVQPLDFKDPIFLRSG